MLVEYFKIREIYLYDFLSIVLVLLPYRRVVTRFRLITYSISNITLQLSKYVWNITCKLLIIQRYIYQDACICKTEKDAGFYSVSSIFHCVLHDSFLVEYGYIIHAFGTYTALMDPWSKWLTLCKIQKSSTNDSLSNIFYCLLWGITRQFEILIFKTKITYYAQGLTNGCK